MASVSREVHQQHRSLMIKLCDMMDPKHATYKNFIFILGASIPKGKLSRVQKNPTEVLALMEEEQLLKAGEYQHLKKALNDSGYKDILDILENGEKRITRQKKKRRDSDGPVADGSSNIEAATMSSVKPEASTSAATTTTLQGSSTQTMKPATTSPTATCTLTPNTSTPQTASVSATSTASSTTLIPTETVNSGATSSIQETPTTIAGISTTGVDGQYRDSTQMNLHDSSTISDQVDESLIEVVQVDSATHAQEPLLWSCKLKATVRKNTNVDLNDIKNVCTTKKEKKRSDEGADKKIGHVMISYNWAHKEKALWINTQLEKNGYPIWIDEKNMGPMLHDSMAEAVEGAYVVLLCMSDNYKNSMNCKQEALYARELKKIIIPLKMEEFRPFGWLGIMTAGYKYYNFSGKCSYEAEMTKLLQELAKYYKKFEEPQIDPFVGTVVPQEETGSAYSPGANQSTGSG